MKLKPPPEDAEAKAQRFGEIAKLTDDMVKAAIDLAYEAAPKDEDAIVSGAMTAVVRFGVERQHAAAAARIKAGKLGAVVTVRDVMAYFVRYVQRSAEILLNKPARPDA